MRVFKARPGSAVLAPATAIISLLLVLAGCGSTKEAATTAAPASAGPPTTTAGGTSSSVKAATYNVNLTHIAASSGAPNSSGVVVLTVRSPSDELCWNISPVRNFKVTATTTMPTIATIQPTPAGTPATPGVPLGFSYKPSDCTHAPGVFLGRLEAHPQMFYVGIFNTHSGDAVHGQV
jgi:hypothetical protein